LLGRGAHLDSFRTPHGDEVHGAHSALLVLGERGGEGRDLDFALLVRCVLSVYHLALESAILSFLPALLVQLRLARAVVDFVRVPNTRGLN